MYLHSYRLDSFQQRSQSRSLFSWRKTGLEHYQPASELKSWNWNRQKFLQSDDLNSTRISSSLFSKNTALSSFFKVSLFSFLLLLHCSIKDVTSHPFNGILSYQNWQKRLLVLTCLENQYHISSALPPSFSLQHVNR